MNYKNMIKNITVVFLFTGISLCTAQTTYPPAVQTESEQKQNPILKQLWSLTEIIGHIIPESKDANAPRYVLPAKIRHAVTEEQVASLELPEDNTIRLRVRDIRFTGNMLITTETLIAEMPLVYNASGTPLIKAQSRDLYDLRGIRDIFNDPNQSTEVSLRSIQGLTQYILSEYTDKGYSGIYVFVPKEAIKDSVSLVDEILPIYVIEAIVSEVTTKFYDVERNEAEEGRLRRNVLESWLPVREGKVAKQKKLDNMLNLLNEDPDRYINAMVSPGSDPNTLAVQYNVYETSPWHYFVQVDNSGTDERQWSPRFGLINTNLLGYDDRFTAIYQAKPDSTYDDNYSLFGSYDFPVAGPRLRLNLYGGYSEFDINPGTGPFNFLGNGSFYGGVLRYNLLQKKGWFFDLIGSLSHEESRFKPRLFDKSLIPLLTPLLTSDVEMDLLSYGINIYRNTDMSSTSLGLTRTQSIGGSSQRRFWDYAPINPTGARTNADRHFAIYSVSVNHSQYLDEKRVQQLRSTFRWIWPNERLVPAKMTSFGGMHSVRGYDEYEIIADGGILASVQYEFDLVRYSSAIEQETIADQKLRKLAPLAFVDYGRSRIIKPVAGEKRHEELCSIGTGLAAEFGNHISAAVYYGYPLIATDDTRRGKGRLNASLMLRN